MLKREFRSHTVKNNRKNIENVYRIFRKSQQQNYIVSRSHHFEQQNDINSKPGSKVLSRNQQQNQKSFETASKIIRKTQKETQKEYEGLSYCDIQNITRTMLREARTTKDPKALDSHMGVLSTIKGRLYCLKLGDVSKSKNAEHFFYCSQYKRLQQKAESLSKITNQQSYSATIQRF